MLLREKLTVIKCFRQQRLKDVMPGLMEDWGNNAMRLRGLGIPLKGHQNAQVLRSINKLCRKSNFVKLKEKGKCMLARRDGVSENRIQMNSKKNAEILFLEHDCT